jgi:hypothetical protein
MCEIAQKKAERLNPELLFAVQQHFGHQPEFDKFDPSELADANIDIIGRARPQVQRQRAMSASSDSDGVLPEMTLGSSLL